MKSFWNKLTSNHATYEQEPKREAVPTFIGLKMTFWNFSNLCRKKFPSLTKEIFCTFRMNVEVLPHHFCKLQPQKLYKNVQEPFCQAWKLFSAEIWKMSECHFWANVMLRQSRLQASRASPAQKWQGLRVVCSKNFSRATLFVFWVTQLVNMCLIYLPVKQIWRKNAVCASFRYIPTHWTSHEDLTEKISENFSFSRDDLDLFWPNSYNLSGCQTHSWILPNFSIDYFNFHYT